VHDPFNSAGKMALPGNTAWCDRPKVVGRARSANLCTNNNVRVGLRVGLPARRAGSPPTFNDFAVACNATWRRQPLRRRACFGIGRSVDAKSAPTISELKTAAETACAGVFPAKQRDGANGRYWRGR